MSEFNENEIFDSTSELEEPIDDISLSQMPPKKRFSSLLDYVELFVIAVCAVVLLFSFVFRTCSVDGPSMTNTLNHKDTLIISDVAYTPSRGDIIVFHQNDDKPIIKRVIGVGGDTVVINFETWEVTVTDKNGKSTTLDEPYIRTNDGSHRCNGVKTYEVPQGTVFVLGDNRNNSKDSTSDEIGFVNVDNILGRVILRVSPVSSFGFVK